MKHYLYSNDPELEFEAEIDSLEPAEIASFGRKCFRDEIYDAIHSTPLIESVQGYFPDPWTVEENLFRQMTGIRTSLGCLGSAACLSRSRSSRLSQIACPITLSESDTGEELILKLDAFFLEKQRGLERQRDL
ncbi:MAG: hypothetical protein K9L88_01215 [Chromatiaceae bacterium]|nr:hypothetical protein [Chromatiaceae bacterium]